MKIALLAGLTASLAACAGAPAAPLPEAPEAFRFRCAGPLDVRFLELRADGAFQFYTRARFNSVTGLSGTWRRTGPSDFALRCDRWSRQVVCGTLRVRFGSAWEAQRPRVREAVAAYLRKHPGRSAFPRAELEDVGCWEEERDLGSGRELVTVIPISVEAEEAPRSDLDRLLAALDGYGREGDPHEVHARLQRHRTLEFLEWIDWSGYSDPVPLDAVRAAIDLLEPGEQLADVWTSVPEAEFQAEVRGNDRFRFYKTRKIR